jgi:hypothetical protein
MNRAGGCCPISFFDNKTKLFLSRCRVIGRDRLKQFANMQSDNRFRGTISIAISKVLTETFLGAYRMWHSKSLPCKNGI